MTTEERKYLSELMSSTLTKAAWEKILADILELQNAKIFVDQLTAAGLSDETWTKAQADITSLLEMKNFIDQVRAAGFSAESWATVYTAALSATSTEEEPETSVTPDPVSDENSNEETAGGT